MLFELLAEAREDRPLWLPELRTRFLADPAARPVLLRLTLHDGSMRDFPTALPPWETEEEREFAASFLYASIYNILAVYSARELCLYFDTADAGLFALYESLGAVFQLREEKRSGYGKVISIASRIAASCGGPAFRFCSAPLSAYRPLPKQAPLRTAALDDMLRTLIRATDGQFLCGIDVGGTDIKLAASEGDRLLFTKEYDWNPAAFPTAEDLLAPILLLTRLMRACLASEHAALPAPLRLGLDAALEKDASDAQILSAVEACEEALGAAVNVLDGVGVSFPDIVISDRILGGENPKTEGMRRCAADYETEFQKLSELRPRLLALCRRGGRVHLTNDGNMAAYTAAVELSLSEEASALRQGVVAHSLGTDLGTGWLLPDGSIPPLPLELYDLLLDLGSFRSRAYAPDDLRSTCNENSGLPGARRYMGQAAAYRLAQALEPALLEGFTVSDGGLLTIASAPHDLRKPCLEHLMQSASEGRGSAPEIFRRIGLHLAVLTEEMEYLLAPKTKTRFLFGRFVKHPAVFSLLREGFESRGTGVRLLPSDDELSKSPLMRALAAREDVTVAQFGQAVGAIYFCLS